MDMSSENGSHFDRSKSTVSPTLSLSVTDIMILESAIYIFQINIHCTIIRYFLMALVKTLREASGNFEGSAYRERRVLKEERGDWHKKLCCQQYLVVEQILRVSKRLRKHPN